ncbi:MAG: hypothetical protein ABIQ16_18980 [Polyangiaceae bacterium]
MAGPPSRSSFPSSSGDPASRRLGLGSGGRDRPLRAQIVVALVAVCILIAVPLYLFRRPGGKSAATAGSASAGLDAGTAPLPPNAGAEVTPLDAGKPPERLRVGPVQHVRCGASAGGGHEGNVCDSVPFFEEALSKAVRENPDCAPKQNEAGSVNYVLTVDFQRKALHLFPGASGQWRGKQARRSINCVKRAFVAPDWATIQHQYRFYTIAVLASYQPASGAPPSPNTASSATPHNPLGTPNFE